MSKKAKRKRKRKGKPLNPGASPTGPIYPAQDKIVHPDPLPNLVLENPS